MKHIGYHRTSTKDQHLDRGITAIQKYCSEQNIKLYKNKVYTDQKTGKNFDRPGYLLVKELLESGDALIITELDRLGRKKIDTLKEIQYFKENNIRLMVLEIPTTLVDYSRLQDSLSNMLMDTVNNLLMEMYATFAQAESDKREIRQREGIEAMKERGEWGRYGRPKKMEQKDFDKEYIKVIDGKIRPFELMKQLNLQVATFYRYRKNFEERRKEEHMKKLIEELRVTLEMDGYELTKENEKSARLILSGRADTDILLQEIIKQYKQYKKD